VCLIFKVYQIYSLCSSAYRLLSTYPTFFSFLHMIGLSSFSLTRLLLYPILSLLWCSSVKTPLFVSFVNNSFPYLTTKVFITIMKVLAIVNENLVHTSTLKHCRWEK
jgi:hypothetical protein